MKLRMTLPSEDAPQNERYSMPDPDELDPVYDAAYRAWFYGDPNNRVLSYEQVIALFTLAAGYLDLTTYCLGQEHCVGKLRDIWRARRKREVASLEVVTSSCYTVEHASYCHPAPEGPSRCICGTLYYDEER